MDSVTILSNSEEMYQYYRIETPELTQNFIYIFFPKIYLYVILYIQMIHNFVICILNEHISTEFDTSTKCETSLWQ